ncbi:hypothetical protein ACFW6F_03080 [Streptomyces sp. NPDC058746]|uniref:hypothetical protein n=1 Tax=Streptomyces sp. NPDC058746 TaxID=3346622 RepID=UPI00369F897C
MSLIPDVYPRAHGHTSQNTTALEYGSRAAYLVLCLWDPHGPPAEARAALRLYEGAYPTRRRAGEAVHQVLAARTGAIPATARWDTGAALVVVTCLTDPDLLARILRQLPGGYPLLFGQAEPRRPRPAT